MFSLFIVFNAVVRLCITELLPAVNRLLKLPEQNSSQKKPVQPSSSKMWTKVRIDLKAYLQDLMQVCWMCVNQNHIYTLESM